MADTVERIQIHAHPSANDPQNLNDDELPLQMLLELNVRDRDIIGALCAQREGEDRDEFALAALKIGVLALRHAGSRMDSDLIQRETSRMLETLETQFQSHAKTVHERLTGELKTYFDPQDGRFHERVERLVKQDGELEAVLRRHVGNDDSAMAKTLVNHFGVNSPLMKVLSPDQSSGLMASLREMFDGQLHSQRERLLSQFSLDNSEGALARLLSELTKNHGRLSEDLQKRIDVVTKEFSLDEDNSALSRLVKNVDAAQQRISAEFTLDNEQSALRRMKDELTTILSAQAEVNADFQKKVEVELNKLVAKREEAARSTRHGTTFELAVLEFCTQLAQPAGDLAEHTGEKPGLIKNRKFGDVVIELGPDSVAAGAKIVIEAKEENNYSLAKAKEEIELARKNRGAQIGIFVFSSKTAPEGLDPLTRYGQDVIVIWDAEDAISDVQLRAALSIAKALCVRNQQERQRQAGDFEAIDKAVLEIEKRSANLAQVKTFAETIHSNSNKILERVRIDRDALDKQVQTLREKIGDLKHASEEL